MPDYETSLSALPPLRTARLLLFHLIFWKVDSPRNLAELGCSAVELRLSGLVEVDSVRVGRRQSVGRRAHQTPISTAEPLEHHQVSFVDGISAILTEPLVLWSRVGGARRPRWPVTRLSGPRAGDSVSEAESSVRSSILSPSEGFHEHARSIFINTPLGGGDRT